ncbi:hypothetical protein MELE44368_21990 [Mycolicibacterium elephantis DSM 44368]|uniref:Uncharacterized protein n=1 Tax=Mycolicibacterium elephantis DSM 44368 TaxID=1335622 RepID=A0A439DSE7_9MYCO|nr:hypothetical protein MELE44368_21990 [Mycolicibacterium elephantis DSM 44368]
MAQAVLVRPTRTVFVLEDAHWIDPPSDEVLSQFAASLSATTSTPVCVVPYGRDQFEVARRVEVARCGTRLPAKKLSVSRLRAKLHEALTMTEGAKRVAEGFAATGGAARGADLFEQRVLAVTDGK